ncbi:hypothetical protein [Bradyrhizobium sp. SZCCHNRI2010]|uniref:hypothetical protein n=1 Tax=Bradyrhizobium sp. SZCCHNRI2010 TaxID=3057283 RepID=UPI0028E8E725|nr:hypothetical protein [Bradyrhizobium sp. SZCCHNRI2010]
MRRLKHDPADRCHCSYCGIAEDIHLLDGVLENEQDTGKLACIKCYPEPDSWRPTGMIHIRISIAPSLKPLYDKYLERVFEDHRKDKCGDHHCPPNKPCGCRAWFEARI